MKKSAKQKKNKQQAQALHPKQQSTSQPQALVTAATGEDPQRLTTDSIDAAPSSPFMPVEQAPAEAETAPSPQQNAPLTLAEVLKQKAALQAQYQQRSQWNQQRKVGKMMNAYVPKRFNRGG